MEGLIFRGVYIRNSLSVYSEYMVGLYTVGLYWWGRGGLYLEVYDTRFRKVLTLAILFVFDVRLCSQSEILSRRVYSASKNIHYVQDFRRKLK